MRLIAALSLVLGLQMTASSALAWEQYPGDWTPGSFRLTGARALAAQSASIDVSSFRMNLPFRTQKDGSAWQGSNCGPAVLGMILDGFGPAGQSTNDLRFRAHTYQGTVGMRTGTSLDHIAHVAEDFGVRTYGLYGAGGSWRSWSADDIR